MKRFETFQNSSKIHFSLGEVLFIKVFTHVKFRILMNRWCEKNIYYLPCLAKPSTSFLLTSYFRTTFCQCSVGRFAVALLLHPPKSDDKMKKSGPSHIRKEVTSYKIHTLIVQPIRAKLCFKWLKWCQVTSLVHFLIMYIKGWKVGISDLFSFRQTVIRKYVREQRRSLWPWLVRAQM